MKNVKRTQSKWLSNKRWPRVTSKHSTFTSPRLEVTLSTLAWAPLSQWTSSSAAVTEKSTPWITTSLDLTDPTFNVHFTLKQLLRICTWQEKMHSWLVLRHVCSQATLLRHVHRGDVGFRFRLRYWHWYLAFRRYSFIRGRIVALVGEMRLERERWHMTCELDSRKNW